MGWTERNWDHERELRKHDWRPGDEPPLSVQRDLSAAEDVIAFIKRTDNYAECVRELEDYCAAERERGRLDAVAAGAHP